MGTFSWVIVAIVLLQVIAGAVAKSAEKRKALEKAKAFRKETLGSSQETSVSATPEMTPPQQPQARVVIDLDTLRKQRLKKLRTPQRGTPAAAPPKRPPAPTIELDLEDPPIDRGRTSAPEGPKQRPAKRPGRPQSTRPTRKDGTTPARSSRAAAASSVHSEGFAGSLLGSDKAMRSEIFDNPIKSTQIGTELGQHREASPNARMLDAMLESPQDLRNGILLAELILPPLALRQEGCGGLG